MKKALEKHIRKHGVFRKLQIDVYLKNRHEPDHRCPGISP